MKIKNWRKEIIRCDVYWGGFALGGHTMLDQHQSHQGDHIVSPIFNHPFKFLISLVFLSEWSFVMSNNYVNTRKSECKVWLCAGYFKAKRKKRQYIELN